MEWTSVATAGGIFYIALLLSIIGMRGFRQILSEHRVGKTKTRALLETSFIILVSPFLLIIATFQNLWGAAIRLFDSWSQ